MKLKLIQYFIILFLLFVSANSFAESINKNFSDKPEVYKRLSEMIPNANQSGLFLYFLNITDLGEADPATCYRQNKKYCNILKLL